MTAVLSSVGGILFTSHCICIQLSESETASRFQQQHKIADRLVCCSCGGKWWCHNTKEGFWVRVHSQDEATWKALCESGGNPSCTICYYHGFARLVEGLPDERHNLLNLN